MKLTGLVGTPLLSSQVCAPLITPVVDLSILGLLLGTRHLAFAGASLEVLRPHGKSIDLNSLSMRTRTTVRRRASSR